MNIWKVSCLFFTIFAIAKGNTRENSKLVMDNCWKKKEVKDSLQERMKKIEHNLDGSGTEVTETKKFKYGQNIASPT